MRKNAVFVLQIQTVLIISIKALILKKNNLSDDHKFRS
jgi:hypothetical protein